MPVGSTASSWFVSALSLLCPLLVLCALTPTVKMANLFKDLAASADFMVHFHCFQGFLVGLELLQIDTHGRKKSHSRY